MSAPLLQSAAPVVAGCDAGPEQVGAGCVGPTGEESHSGDPPMGEAASAGCAAADTRAAEPVRPQPPATVRDFESALRTLGFTNRQAKAIARKGFAAASAAAVPEPDPDELQMQSLMAALQRRAAALKG